MKIVIPTMITAVLLLSHTAFANLNGFIETVTVGNTGNAPDPATGGLHGSVAYQYDIGKYEVTNSQYAAFLNSVASSDPHNLYNSNMGTHAQGGIIRMGSSGSYYYTVKAGFENRPVNFISFIDAARFSNWLTNGMGTGSTESGAYDMSEPIATMVRSAPTPGMQFQVFVASEDEWYKAAYYDPTLNGGSGGYWSYPTQSNTEPSNGAPTGSGNRANYGNNPNYVTDVGAYGISSYYGTFDQEGNLSEFTDTIFPTSKIGQRSRRGSSYSNTRTGAEFRTHDVADQKAASIGFRIAVVQIPEPSTYAAIFGGTVLIGVLWVRNKKRRGQADVHFNGDA